MGFVHFSYDIIYRRPLLYLGDVHKLRNALGGGQRFFTNHCKDIGICTVFCYKGEGGLKSCKIALRIMWTTPIVFMVLLKNV